MSHITHEEARIKGAVRDWCREERAECNRQLVQMKRELRHDVVTGVACFILAILIALTLTGCDALPEALGPAQNAVVEAQRAVDEVEADGTATPEQVADARHKLELAQTALDKISNDSSPEAGIAEVIGGVLASTTGQPWFYIAGAGIAGYLRQRHKTKIAKSNGVALAKSVQPAIDAVDESVKTRIRDLQKGQPGISEIVNAAKTTN